MHVGRSMAPSPSFGRFNPRMTSTMRRVNRRSFLVPLGAALAAVSVAAGHGAAQAAAASRKGDSAGNAMQLLALPLFDALPGWRLSHSSHASHSSHVSSVNVGPPPVTVPQPIVPGAPTAVAPAPPTAIAPALVSPSRIILPVPSTAVLVPAPSLSIAPAQPAKPSKRSSVKGGAIVLVALAALGGGIAIGRIRRRPA